MEFTFRFQDPAADTMTLLEVLLGAIEDADRGAAVFAFASRSGVSLLFDDADFQAFLNRSQFELLVGVDAVTAPAALDRIREAMAHWPGFTARVFFHATGRHQLFHPKFCWFGAGSQVRVVVGSGNLTGGGLLANWEAFGDAKLRGRERTDFLAAWTTWRTASEAMLRRIDDPDVIVQARRNQHDTRRRHEEIVVERAIANEEIGVAGAQMLLAEIPRASTRWHQANFDLDSFRQFFQLQPNSTQRVVLFPVQADGAIGEPEVRPGVSVKSHNFRIELGQAAGLDYPVQGRPIGLFHKIGTRRFRYRLLMPDDVHYAAVSQLMSKRWTGRSDRMKRIRLGLADFQGALPQVKT